MKGAWKWSWLPVVPLLLAGCAAPSAPCASGTADSADVTSLRAEVTRLQAENRELRDTPDALFASFSTALSKEDTSTAEAALERLQSKYPNSAQARGASDQLAAFRKQQEQKAAEAARIAALGFKALKVSPRLDGDEASVQLRAVKKSGRWTSDAYGDEWHYREAEKGSVFITARATVTSKSKDPKLPGIGVYKAKGDTLELLGLLGYDFARWDDYGSYLGNTPDYGNDFAHRSSIPFSLGLSVTNEAAKETLYLVGTKTGCFERYEVRFGNPPVRYSEDACGSLPRTLKASDFADSHLSMLGRL